MMVYGEAMNPTELATYPAPVRDFVTAMHATTAGRNMAERVFAQLAGRGATPAGILTDVQLATYITDRDWTFGDVVRREN